MGITADPPGHRRNWASDTPPGRPGRGGGVPADRPSAPRPRKGGTRSPAVRSCDLACAGVLPVIDLRRSGRDPAGVLPRAPGEAVEAARDVVRQLVGDIAARGDASVADAARRFDGVDTPPAAWRVTPDELAAAEAALD